MASGRGAAGGAMAGGSIGSMFGPWGTGFGAGLGALIGLFGSGGDKPMSPELERLYDLEMRRQQSYNPLLETVNRMALARLPPSVRQGAHFLSYPEAYQQEGLALGRYDPTADDYAEDPKIREVLRMQGARMRMADPIVQAVIRMAGSRLPPAYATKRFI